jgi:hypothetical protein
MSLQELAASRRHISRFRGSLSLLILTLFSTLLAACGDSYHSGERSIPQDLLVRPFALQYANSSVAYPVGQPIISNAPSVRGGPVDAYSIAPALPAGLAIDPKTGVISGTPTTTSVATIYAVTATNAKGSTIGRGQIEVTEFVIAPDSLRYSVQSAIYPPGKQIPPNLPITTGGQITQYTIAPSLPSGLTINSQTGIISGTPATVQPATQYTVTGANTAGEVQTNISIAIQSVGPPVTTPPGVPPATVAYTDAVYVVGQPIIPNTPAVSGGKADAYSVEPLLPAGLSIAPQTGVISGTPTTATASTIYAVTASNTYGSAIGRVQIEVANSVVAPGSLSYSPSSETYLVGQPISPNVPSTTGGQITQFTVAPSLPTGLTLNPQTGIISGTPTIAQSIKQYIVTGANTAGSVQTTISIAVQLAPPLTPEIPPATVSYTDAVYVVGQPIVPNVPTLTGGVPAAFAISPALPPGLDLDNVTGAITGVPTTPHAATLYRVTASNTGGEAQGQLTLTVTDVGTWTPSGSLITPRLAHAASLRSDGTVLVTAGFNSTLTIASVETRAPTGIWSRIQSLATQRFLHTSTTLRNDSVLVVGGADQGANALNSVEIFNTQWATAAPTITARYDHTATLLADGRVLVVGGIDENGNPSVSAEVYDPHTNIWTLAASLNLTRANHAATLLADGRVLVTGGENRTGILASAEVYDPVANTWAAIPGMGLPRVFHTASLLADGSVLIAGGSTGAGGLPTNAVELFNPLTMSWQPMPPMTTRRDAHTATVMSNGQVVVAGGASGIDSDPLSSVEIFDPASGQWLAAASMANARTAHTATLLPDGRLLVVGGKGASYLDSSEVFDISRSGF